MMLTKNLLCTTANADTSTLLVKVQESSSDTTTNTYSLGGGYNNVTSTSKVYFIQEGKTVNTKFILVMV